MLTEEQLQSYAKPASESEQLKMENAYIAIKKIVHDHPHIDNSVVEIIKKGSSHNNTNVRNEADIDLTIVNTSSFFYKIPNGFTASDFNIIPAKTSFDDHKNEVKKSVYNRFSVNEIDDSKDKCTRIKPNSYRVETDIVPAWRYRLYDTTGNFDEGIAFISDSGDMVINFPEQHTENGIEKNNNTGRKYKRVVRILKRLKSKMKEDSIPVSENITSFLIESLVWNVKDSIFNQGDSYSEILRNVLIEIYNNTSEDWNEVSGILRLFHADRKWTVDDVKTFINQVWKYGNFK